MPNSFHKPCTTRDNNPFLTKDVVGHPCERDQLDAPVDQASSLFSTASTWQEFATAPCGRDSDFHANAGSLPPPAAPTLEQLRAVGARVEMSAPNWSAGKRQAAMQRDPHKSAKEHIKFLRQEFTDMINKGQRAMLPARLPEGTLLLRLSPLGVVPQ